MKLGKYQHFKGAYYQVLHIAKHSETEELMVVYQPLYGKGDIWVRPYNIFDEYLLKDGQKTKRFRYVET